MSTTKNIVFLLIAAIVLGSGCNRSSLAVGDIQRALEKNGFEVLEMKSVGLEENTTPGLTGLTNWFVSNGPHQSIALSHFQFETTHQVLEASFDLSQQCRPHHGYLQSGGFGNVFIAVIGFAERDSARVNSIFEVLKAI